MSNFADLSHDEQQQVLLVTQRLIDLQTVQGWADLESYLKTLIQGKTAKATRVKSTDEAWHTVTNLAYVEALQDVLQLPEIMRKRMATYQAHLNDTVT